MTTLPNLSVPLQILTWNQMNPKPLLNVGKINVNLIVILFLYRRLNILTFSKLILNCKWRFLWRPVLLVGNKKYKQNRSTSFNGDLEVNMTDTPLNWFWGTTSKQTLMFFLMCNLKCKYRKNGRGITNHRSSE